MKKINLLSLLFMAFAAVMFTSCLDDDDDDNNALTPDEIQTCFNTVRGGHTGMLIYQGRVANGNLRAKNDTVNASWSIMTDSTMSFRSIPDSVIATVAQDTAIMNAISRQGGHKNIDAYIGFVKLSPVQWLINPMTVTYDNLDYRGGKHKVQIVFLTNSAYSFGQRVTDNGGKTRQVVQLIAAAMFIDGTQASEGIVQIGTQRMKPFYFIEG